MTPVLIVFSAGLIAGMIAGKIANILTKRLNRRKNMPTWARYGIKGSKL